MLLRILLYELGKERRYDGRAEQEHWAQREAGETGRADVDMALHMRKAH